MGDPALHSRGATLMLASVHKTRACLKEEQLLKRDLLIKLLIIS